MNVPFKQVRLLDCNPDKNPDSDLNRDQDNSAGETAVLIHYVALIGNHSIVPITHCRWRCGS